MFPHFRWAAALLCSIAPSAFADVVINEIHFDETDKTLHAEFVELHNTGDADIDLTGWYFAEGFDFVFPASAKIAAGDFVVVAQNPAVLKEELGAEAFGPWLGNLRNSGEDVVLRDAGGNVIDSVSYKLGFPWPTVGEEPSPSIELINPTLDNDLGGSWRSSGNAPRVSVVPKTYVEPAQQWDYFKGTEGATRRLETRQTSPVAQRGSRGRRRSGLAIATTTPFSMTCSRATAPSTCEKSSR